MTKLKRCYAFFLGEMEKAMAYRGAFFLSAIADVIPSLVMLAVWVAVYQRRSTVAGFTYPMMITYLLVSQTVNNMYSFRNDASRSISSQIRKGNIVFDLLRPVDFVQARLFENLGQSTFKVLLCVLFFLVFKLFFPELSWPASGTYFLLFLLSMVAGYVIMFSVCVMSGLLSFWLMNSWGLRNARIAIVNFLSGSLIPFFMLPEWMQTVIGYLPFKGIVYTPTMIYMGQYDMKETLFQLGLQVFWAVVMWLLTRLLCNAAIKRVSVNGG
ncbi:MAG: ABC-2 family transporter protein [Bacteroidales bacterium]|nr:ABC-2 family transporter protein [Lachnospiraceae bacterium]MCF0168706.1 ABC-2 family transporter protein [Bacteroidales bacterium]